MPAPDEEPRVLAIVLASLRRWLTAVKAAVFASGRDTPDPSGVQVANSVWFEEVDRRILPALEVVSDHAWRWQSGEPFVSSRSFQLAQLALTRNLLVRLPSEVYNSIFAEITEGTNAGESNEQIAARIDRTLLSMQAEWWHNRAKVITQTETNRAWNAGRLAAAQYYEPPTGPGWLKVWNTDMDGHERPAHRRANGQARRLSDTFQVGGEDLRFPGDPAGRPDNVIFCRCGMDIRKGS